MARPKKPSKLKELQGTDRADRHNYLEPEPPELKTRKPPEWLRGEGVKVWERVLPILASCRVMTEADLESFGHYCQLHGNIVDDYYKEKKMAPAQHLSQLRLYSAMFGVDPSSRGKLQVEKTKEKTNKFAALRKI